MLDFAKDKKFWEKVRTSNDYAQHRQEVLELYEKAFKTEPRPHSAKEILENNDNGLWRLQFDQLQTASMLSLIYPEEDKYVDAFDFVESGPYNTIWMNSFDMLWRMSTGRIFS